MRKPLAAAAVVLAIGAGTLLSAQGDPDKVIPGGGVFVQGWTLNGSVIADYDRAQLVAPGKLHSLDGVYGIRFTHNVEAVITGFSMTKD